MNTSVPGQSSFDSTRWTLVLRAKGSDLTPEQTARIRREALGKLIEAYWKPLYCFLRKKGHSKADAEDLTQSFFTTFLEKDFLKSVDRDKGRFRTFLLVALEHFISNEYDKARAQKRGGMLRVLSLDFDDAERRYITEPSVDETPEKLYLRKWTRTLTQQVMDQLEDEFKKSDKGELFEAIKPHLAGGEDYASLAERLNMSVSNVKVTVHRARNRYRELLRQSVRDTVESDAQVDAELWELINAL
jgi:RNA polymerase sigma-70 factor (ECF subfamily)